MEIKNVSKRAFIFGEMFIQPGDVVVIGEPWAHSDYIKALIDRGDVLEVSPPPKKKKRKKPKQGNTAP